MPDISFKCGSCGQSLEAPSDMMGQQIACPTCGKPLILPAITPPPSPTQKTTSSCPFCGESILAQAKKCKHCGEFLDNQKEATEYESHPSMFRGNPVGFIICVALCFVGIGFVILLFWWMNTLGTTLTVTNKRSILRKGILSKSTTEVRHQDIRNIQIKQSIFQRLLGVGAIGISSAGQSGIEIEAAAMPSPQKVKDIINKYRR